MDSRPARVRAYLAMSLDGFIAGPGDDLSWLPEPPYDDMGSPEALSYEEFIADVGALLMGRGTYDVVRGFDVDWPYGNRPVLVATGRELDADPPSTVRRIDGPIESMVAEARSAAGGKDVYIDGGALIRQACDAGLIDEMTVTLAPVALGAGHALFAGLQRRLPLEIAEVHRHLAGMIQLRLVPIGSAAEGS